MRYFWHLANRARNVPCCFAYTLGCWEEALSRKTGTLTLNRQPELIRFRSFPCLGPLNPCTSGWIRVRNLFASPVLEFPRALLTCPRCPCSQPTPERVGVRCVADSSIGNVWVEVAQIGPRVQLGRTQACTLPHQKYRLWHRMLKDPSQQRSRFNLASKCEPSNPDVSSFFGRFVLYYRLPLYMHMYRYMYRLYRHRGLAAVYACLPTYTSLYYTPSLYIYIYIHMPLCRRGWRTMFGFCPPDLL